MLSLPLFMKGNLLLEEMSLIGPQNPQSGAPSLGSEESCGEAKAERSLSPPVLPAAVVGVLVLRGTLQHPGQAGFLHPSYCSQECPVGPRPGGESPL